MFAAPEGGIAVWDACASDGWFETAPGLRDAVVWCLIPPVGGSWPATGDRTAPRVTTSILETGRVLFDRRSQVGPGAITWMPTGDCWPSAVPTQRLRLRLERWRRSAFIDKSKATVPTSLPRGSHTLVTYWPRQASMARPGSGTAVSGEPLAIAPGTLQGSFAEDDRQSGVQCRWEDRRLGCCRGVRMPDAASRPVRQSLRGPRPQAAFRRPT